MSRIKIYTLEITYPTGGFAPLQKPELKLIPTAGSRLNEGYARKVWGEIIDENYHILAVDGKIKYTDVNPNRKYKFLGHGVSVYQLFEKLDLSYQDDKVFWPAYKRLDKVTAEARRLQKKASRLFARAEMTKKKAVQLGGQQVLEPELSEPAGYFFDRHGVDSNRIRGARLAEVYYDQLTLAEQLENQAMALEVEYKY